MRRTRRARSRRLPRARAAAETSQPEKEELSAKLEELQEAERQRDRAASVFKALRNSVDTAGEFELYARLEEAEERVQRIAEELEQAFGVEPD